MPYNMVVLKQFFATNHSLLNDLQNSNELNQSINARLPKLAANLLNSNTFWPAKHSRISTLKWLWTLIAKTHLF